MSEKVTFQELIDSIAEETDNSKKFTHDFLKDFVDVINEGLEEDGNVNIAGFGKFKLRPMDEREGYNPQTGEKITIPAHNKVIFKPYKDLRELVNAPYADMEPEMLEEGKSTGQEADSEEERPSGGPDTETPTPAETPERDAQELSDDDGTSPEERIFGLGSGTSSKSKFSFDEGEDADLDDEDIVEYTPEAEEPADKEFESAFGISDESEEEEVQNTEESDTEEDTVTDSRFMPAGSDRERDSAEEAPEEPAPTLADQFEDSNAEGTHEDSPLEEEEKVSPWKESGISFKHSTGHRKPDNSSVIWAAAAVLILVLMAGGIWYFYFQDQPSGNQLAQTEVTSKSPTTTPAQEESKGESQQDQEEQQDQSSETATQQDQQQNTAQNQATGSGSSSGESSSSTPSFPDEITVEKGQTLWGLAHREYKDSYLWPWIYDANLQAIENPDLIQTGMTLSLPMPDLPSGSLSATDSLEVAIGYVRSYTWYKQKGQSQAKYYLWAAQKFDSQVFDHVDIPIDKDDLAFAKRVR